MSRLIIKNLPNTITTGKLKEIFSEKGQVTDVQLKYTKDGKFRNFGFVGYKTEEEANLAKEYFHNTCINSLKVAVEICTALGDASKPRAWSKYALDSTAYKKHHKMDENLNEISKKKKRKKKSEINKLKEILKKHNNDPMFTEFIEAHTNEKTTWIKELLDEVSHENSDTSGEDQDKDNEKPDKTKKETVKENDISMDKKKEKTANKNISDFEYMKLLMKKSDPAMETKEQTGEVKEKKVRNRQLYHVKVTGLPFKCKKRDIKDLFKPLVPYTIRFPQGKDRKVVGFCYVGFRTEDERKKAFYKDKLFIGTHRIRIMSFENKTDGIEQHGTNTKLKREKEMAENEESIGESGKIFVRNLPYITNEDELTKLFEKYGPLSDVNMPIDKVLRQPKGFATITFMMPEHAARAFTELDGTVFCGRMLHLLPGKESDRELGADNEEGLSFKEKKAKKLKSQAKSSHNWNTLFLGANAVADVIAENFNTTKEHLLTGDTNKTSAAVRLALGETQLVAETKSFLEENGVFLDAFNEISKRRSKTCMLVKNLPANTRREELQPLFQKYGQLARFVLPKHGITAIVEFIEPSEARTAFTKLAYSQFKMSPLYLEWASDNIFFKPADSANLILSNEASLPDKSEEGIEPVKELLDPKLNDEDEVPENDSTLFVKNLNFITVEDDLRKHFSKYGRLASVTITRKKDPKNPGKMLSMGYGFVQYYTKLDADEALKNLQYTTLDGKKLELKRSERGNSTEVVTLRKSSKPGEQTGTKILVRNVPFQANRNELHEIFRAFGEIKSLRLPKKMSPNSEEQHRGFCFVDFHTKADAKSAFEAVSKSTHLYGRRLVLEWAGQDDLVQIDEIRKRTATTFNMAAPGGKKSMKASVDVETYVES